MVNNTREGKRKGRPMTEKEKRARLEARRRELQEERDGVVRTATNHAAGIDARLKVVGQELALLDTLDERRMTEEVVS